jgi:hypothetical protein
MTTSDQHCHFTISGGSNRHLLLLHLCSFLIFHSSLPRFHISVLFLSRLFQHVIYTSFICAGPSSLFLLSALFLYVFMSPLSVPLLYQSYYFFFVSICSSYNLYSCLFFISVSSLYLFSFSLSRSVIFSSLLLFLLYVCLSFISVSFCLLF